MIENIDLSDYILIGPESIQKVDGFQEVNMILEIQDDNTFFIKGENNIILSHNCDGFSIADLINQISYIDIGRKYLKIPWFSKSKTQL
jgi:hypothetical protein